MPICGAETTTGDPCRRKTTDADELCYMHREGGSTGERYTPDEVVAALKKTKGMIYLAAEVLGCSAPTVYRYRDEYDAVAECIKHERGRRHDVSEMKLLKAVNRDEKWAIMFDLKNSGRGYGTDRREHQHEFAGGDGGGIKIVLPDDGSLHDEVEE